MAYQGTGVFAVLKAIVACFKFRNNQLFKIVLKLFNKLFGKA